MMIKTVLVLFFSILVVSCQTKKESLKMITLNIRYDNPADGINAWPERKSIVVDFLKNENPALIGLQEALWQQYIFIDSMLTHYSSVAAGRDDGERAGEMCPVFYRNDLFDLHDSGTFWLSETPEVAGSKGWGAVLPRIVTWSSLVTKESGSRFYIFNTHFSHMSDSARVMSSRVLRSEVKKVAGDDLFIITGDFNMLPESRAYGELAIDPITDSFIDSSSPPEGEISTFNGFSNTAGYSRIDYIFVKRGIDIHKHTTQSVYRDSLFISDHWPVIVSLSF
jgi:endonuclease/exonuclease/phosphatase family metal-dependent hydrolase